MPAELPRRAAAAATAAHRWRPCRPHVAGLRSIGWRSTHEQTREERGVALAEELDDDGAATERQRVERLLRADGRVARLVADERLALLQVGEEVLHGAVLLAQRLQRRLVELQHTAQRARYSHSMRAQHAQHRTPLGVKSISKIVKYNFSTVVGQLCCLLPLSSDFSV